MAMKVRWLHLIFSMSVLGFIVGVAGEASAADQSGGFPPPDINIVHIQDPDGLALSVKWDIDSKKAFTKGDGLKLLDWKAKIDMLVAFEDNKTEKANGSLSLGYSMDSGVGGGVLLTRISLNAGLESAPVFMNNVATGWELQNYNAGLILEQDLPWTDRIAGVLSGILPSTGPLLTENARISLSEKRVFSQEPETRNDYWRTSISLDWSITMWRRNNLFTWTISPHGEWMWEDNGVEHHYLELESDLWLSVLKHYDAAVPILFVKYVNGEPAPNYEKVDQWQFGIGEKFLF